MNNQTAVQMPGAIGGVNRVKYKFRTTWTMGEMFLYALVWLLLLIVTFGIASFFLPYAWAAKFLNGTEVYGPQGELLGVLEVEISMMEQLAHILGWLLLSIVTLGIAFVVYQVGVVRTILNHTRIVDPLQ